MRVVVGATVGATVSLSNYKGEIVLPATLHALGLTNLDKFPQAPKVKKLVRCHPNLTRRASRSRLRFLSNDRESERGTTAASSIRIGHWSFALEILI